MINNDDRFCPAPKIAHRTIGGRVAIVKPNENRFITLNETASFIWKHIETQDVFSLVKLMSEEFDVSLDNAATDVRVFLEKLSSNELIVPRITPGETTV